MAAYVAAGSSGAEKLAHLHRGGAHLATFGTLRPCLMTHQTPCLAIPPCAAVGAPRPFPANGIRTNELIYQALFNAQHSLGLNEATGSRWTGRPA